MKARQRLFGALLVAGAFLAGVPSTAAVAAPAAAPGLAPGPATAPEYWFDDWDVPALWQAGARGQGVTIAVIDTGVNAALPQLRGRVLAGADVGAPGDGRVDRDLSAFGHGTAMASIMVGAPGPFGIRGIAPAAKILPIAVPLTGTSDADRPDNLPQAVTYAADHGAKVISMSLGGVRTPTDGTGDGACPDDEQAAIFHALAKGAIVLAAVGNTGPAHSSVEEPGVCLGVVSVGAVDASGTVARFSGRQPYLSLVAPGVDVPSLGRVPGQAFSGSGTSQATALAAAATALVWSKYPQLAARQVVARLLATLDGKRSRHSPEYGYGELDAGAAVTADVPADAANPVFDAAAPFERRAAALRQVEGRASGLGAPPPPAPRRSTPDAGRYLRDGANPLLRARLLLGVGLAVIGAIIFGLATAGLRRRRARRPVELAFLPGDADDPNDDPADDLADDLAGGRAVSGPVAGALPGSPR